MRIIASIVALMLFSGSAKSFEIPLESEAPIAYARAKLNFLKRMNQKVGMAGIIASVDECYSIAKTKLNKVQYCYALHVVAHQYDKMFFKEVLKTDGNTQGLFEVETVLRAEKSACPAMNLRGEKCLFVLYRWQKLWG